MLGSSWQAALFLFVLFEWLVRFAMIFVVPRGRKPSVAGSWLLIIMIFPTIGSVLFFMFSDPKLPRHRGNSQSDMDALTNKELKLLVAGNPDLFSYPVDKEYSKIARLAESLSGMPPMNGNKVSYITDYKDMITQQAESIKKAKEYVHIEYYILVMDKSTEPLFSALEEAAKKGVKIRILVDSFSHHFYGRRSQIRKRFTDMGAEMVESLPLYLIPGAKFTRPDLRNHRKMLVIDGTLAYSGSSNIIKKTYHRKDSLEYEDMMLRLEGPIVWQFNNVFRADWYVEKNEKLLDLVEDEDMPPAKGDSLMQLLPSGPAYDRTNNPIFYASLFYAAREKITIVMPYFIPDESLLMAVLTAATRGVKVTIINSEIMDKPVVGHAQRSYYDELLAAGVEVYLYKSPIFLHNKQVLIDDYIALTGSSNMNSRSLTLSMELNIVSYDKKAVKELYEISDKYQRNSRKIHVRLWEQRPFKTKLAERLSRLLAPMI
ncbi:MAG: cardiolipin synthase [Candidatus Saccharimonadales bacterium]|jgi:cardiolipin synthase